MAAENPMAMLSAWIAKLEIREAHLTGELEELTDRLKEVRENLTATMNSLQKMRDLVIEFRDNPDGPAMAFDEEEEPAKANRTQFERIEVFLKGKHNLPQTIAEIEKGTRIPRTSISAVLYRTHHSKFVNYELPDKRGKAWRLAGLPGENADIPFDDPPPADKDIPF